MIADLKCFADVGENARFAITSAHPVGIGANSAIFSVIDAVLLRPLFPGRPAYFLWGQVKHEGDDLQTGLYPNYADFRSIEDLAWPDRAFTRASAILSGNEEARELSGPLADIFPVLGETSLGRPFTRR
jgi:hypothetical protein